jgi:hypothetical protein
MVSFFVLAVIENHVKAARHCDDELMQIFMSMAAALRASWDVVEIVDARYSEGDVPVSLDKREVAPRILDLGKIDDAAFADIPSFGSLRGLWIAPCHGSFLKIVYSLVGESQMPRGVPTHDASRQHVFCNYRACAN